MPMSSDLEKELRLISGKGTRRYFKLATGFIGVFIGLGLVVSPFILNYMIFTDPPEKEFLESGKILVLAGRYEDALNILNQGIKMNPRQSQGYIFRAVAYTALGRKQEAEQDVMQAVRIIYDVRPIDIEREIDRILRETD